MTSKSANALLAAAVSVVRTVHTESSAPARRTTADLFDAHAAFVLRLVRHLGVASSDAEDVTQEVFMVAHQRLTTLQYQESARSWLFGIARRVAANHVRKTKRRRTDTVLPIEELTAATSGDPALELELARQRALLMRALDRLDADKRAVFVLFELEGLAMPEVAEIIGCPINTAYSRLYAARIIVQRSVLGTRALSSAALTSIRVTGLARRLSSAWPKSSKASRTSASNSSRPLIDSGCKAPAHRSRLPSVALDSIATLRCPPRVV